MDAIGRSAVRVLVAIAAVLVNLGVSGRAAAQEPPVEPEVAVVDARRPSISDAADWAVYEATLADGRRSVFRVNLAFGVSTEMSPVPPGSRRGDTVQPKLSADGCVIVAITQVAFDLFRDDDRNSRWDAYRLLVPECGGRPNGWELVSSTSAGTSRDDVFTDWSPAINGSGSLIAYTHQHDRTDDPLAMISLVDATVPIAGANRTFEVAGAPVEVPNRAYSYRGFTAPVLSQNGRHLAFVADAAASDPLPGWAAGPVPGGPATRQVFVWDRAFADQRSAVRLVSGRDGVGAAMGADSPALSEDGRIVAFRSADRRLVEAVLPPCTEAAGCATQIFRFDRDTDNNGVFDETARANPLALVSAIDAGVTSPGLPMAGDGSSRSPALSADGSQIVFVTDAENLLPSRRPGGGAASDGDVLVAEFRLAEIRRVLDGDGQRTVPGAHERPAISRTGQAVVFDTEVAGALPGATLTTTTGRNLAFARVTPRLGLADLDFGSVTLGFESEEFYTAVQNGGPGGFEPDAVFTSSPNFRVTGGTCKPGVIVAAGDFCTVRITFNPSEPRGFVGTLTVRGAGYLPSIATAELRGAAGDPVLSTSPGGADFERAVVGESGGRVAIGVTNIGFLPSRIARVELAGKNPAEFEIVTQSCTDRALNATAACAIELEFKPRAPGYRSALVRVTTAIGEYTSAVVAGYARYQPTFNAAVSQVTAGEPLVVGGFGFPAGGTVEVSFDDGSPAFATFQATAEGGFFADVEIPASTRPGIHRLVASGASAAVATAEVRVVANAHARSTPLPGFGLG